jgi:hypothetical protein
MKVGDRVRLMHGREEGKIIRLLEKSLVEVEIEDGFAIPVLQSELVLVSPDESTSFDMPVDKAGAQKSKIAPKTESVQSSLKGHYVAIIPLNDRLSSIYLLNFSNDDLLVLANEINNKNEERSILSEKIFNNNFIKITERNLDHINSWLPIGITILTETAKWAIPSRPDKIILNIKAKHFQKEEQLVPLINKKGYLIPLNQAQTTSVAPLTIDAEKLKNSFFESDEETKQTSARNHFSESEVDLHIEAIDPNYENLPKEDMLRIQIAYFEQKLDQAILAGLDEIIFVHGVGNGVLKSKIHKLLSESKSIKFFKDAHKEKFGYGATLVQIK